MRDFRTYRTGNEAIDNVLDLIHRNTMRQPSDWHVPGEQFGDWIGYMIQVSQLLPDGHPVKAVSSSLYTGGSHLAWSPQRTEEFYRAFIGKMWPALDAVEDAPEGEPTIADPVREKWREAADRAYGNDAKLKLCREIIEHPVSQGELRIYAKRVADKLAAVKGRKIVRENEQGLIDRAFYVMKGLI